MGAASVPIAAQSEASAATVTVTNCQDSGPGSLRDAVARAASGDTIDMSTLACREIQLTSGAIEVAQHRLFLSGGHPGLMKIDAGRRSRVFWHSGRGILRFTRINIANGRSLEGGCLFSMGKVELLASKVHGCRASQAEPGDGRGGGIYADTVRLDHSWVTGNAAAVLAGGVYATSGLTATRSRISNNRAGTRAALWVRSGKTSLLYSAIEGNQGNTIIEVFGELNIANSTISGNTGDRQGWPTIGANGGAGGAPLALINSTISGNVSGSGTVALGGDGPKTIVNSTIAFNRVIVCDELDGNNATVVLGQGATPLDSTIISNNSCNGNPYDSVRAQFDSQPATLVGANNLITTPAQLQLPADTISADPRLLLLADNGGPANTHALRADSPAIDAGNNEAGLAYDERGPGFPRVKGTRADIGAFER